MSGLKWAATRISGIVCSLMREMRMVFITSLPYQL
jgi:hypothetical protein